MKTSGSNALPVLLTLAASCALVGAAHAHHSFATHYDASKSTQLTGVVTKWDFRSPHSFIFMNVPKDGGGATPYEVELHSLPVTYTSAARSQNVTRRILLARSCLANRWQTVWYAAYGVGIANFHAQEITRDSSPLSRYDSSKCQCAV